MNPFMRAKYFFKSKDVPTWKKVAGVLAILYVIDPIDLIPDTIPIIGWLDDIGAIGALIAMIFSTPLPPTDAPASKPDAATPAEFEVLKDK